MAGRKRANGDGSLRRRSDGRWEARYVLFEDGRIIRRSIYARTREEASKTLRQALKARDDGAPLPTGRATVAEYLREWFVGATPSLRATSVTRYRQCIEDHLIPGVGRHRLIDLRPAHVQTFYTRELEAGISPATVRLIHAVLHRALEQAVRWNRVTRSVADLVDLPRLPRTEAGSLGPGEVRRVLVALEGHRLEALFVIALTAGLRRGELLALRWQDVELDAGALHVRGTLAPDGGITEPKTRTSRRRVPLGPLGLAALRRHRLAQAAERLRADPWDERDLVFTKERGGPLALITLQRAWWRALEAAGCQRLPFHATRHTAASLMVAAGVNPRVASERLGHATVAMTMDRYSHLTDAVRTDAANAIDAVLRTA
jgi:integrase